MKRYIKSTTSPTGATNYMEYIQFVVQNTHLSSEEAFTICNPFWNRGVHKYDAVKMINDGIVDEDDVLAYLKTH